MKHNNNGYLYGDGFNAVGTLHISGSLSKDLAVGITPRFSWDKDEHGDASLVEGYAKTHLGVWGITAGRQPMSWGVGRAGQLAFGSNATPQTAIKLNLLEPHTFDNGALKFLGKANVNVFASRLEGNRVASSGSALEKDHAALVGVRVDIMPTDAFTIGLERMSMLKKFNKHWLLGDNADDAERIIGTILRALILNTASRACRFMLHCMARIRRMPSPVKMLIMLACTFRSWCLTAAGICAWRLPKLMKPGMAIGC